MTTRKTAPKSKPATHADVEVIIAIKALDNYYLIDTGDSFGGSSDQECQYAVEDNFTLHRVTIQVPIPPEKDEDADVVFASDSIVDITE